VYLNLLLRGADGTVRVVHALVRATHVKVLRRIAVVNVADPTLCVSFACV